MTHTGLVAPAGFHSACTLISLLVGYTAHLADTDPQWTVHSNRWMHRLHTLDPHDSSAVQSAREEAGATLRSLIRP
ncbi:hypothetical protein ACWDUL_20140 [Nocardia niigatensis]